MKLSDLKAAPYNPRRITPEAAAGLRASLGTFGDIGGIVWNQRTGHLVAGHQRVVELRKAHGDLEIRDGLVCAPDGHEYPVRVVDWDEQTEKAANLAANNPHIGGEFTEGLGVLLDEVRAADAELFERLKLDNLEATPAVEGDGGERDGLDVPESYGFKIVVDCADEGAQLALMERLIAEGYECRALIA